MMLVQVVVLLVFALPCLSASAAFLKRNHEATDEQIYPKRSLQADGVDEVREKTYFQVGENEADHEITSPGVVHISIYYPNPDKWYSVTVESNNQYTGVANFMFQLKERGGQPLLYSWTPKMSGSYEIIVHELNHRSEGEKTPRMEGEYKFNVVDKPEINSRQILLDQIVNMPPCQSVNRGDLYSVWDGTWLGPQMHGHVSGMRNGWYFLPSADMNCKLEYYTDSELRRNNAERSIYILGSSKERGVFLSLVDMLLDSDEKKHMDESVISKCWGRAHVTKSNIKVLYQDFRSAYFQHAGASSDYLCHNEKVVREGGGTYTDNGMRVWEEMFEDEQSLWPSVILWGVTNHEGFDDAYDLQHFINTLPSSWQGTLLLTDGAFSASRAGSGDEAEYIRYRRIIKKVVAGLNDSRVRWVDGKGVSKEMRMYGELGPERVIGSQHFHSQCNRNYLDESGHKQNMRICSNTTELLGQLLIGYALGPKNEYTQRIEQSGHANNENNQAVYCHACPDDLLPFHITHHPDMICATGALHPRVKNEIQDKTPQICPEPCLDIPPHSTRETQSGPVYERNCPMEYFIQEDTQVEKLDQSRNELALEHQMTPLERYIAELQESHNHAVPVNNQVRSPAEDFAVDRFFNLELYIFCVVNMVIILGLTTVFKSRSRLE